MVDSVGDKRYYSQPHALLTNATVVRSDYPIVRKVFSVWESIINFQFFQFRPVLSVFSLFSNGHRGLRHELNAIQVLSEATKHNIREKTVRYGGESEKDFLKVLHDFDATDFSKIKQENIENGYAENAPAAIYWYSKSDSLKAAQDFQKIHKEAKIAITNFANSVRVGGADRSGGKGSQEEYLMRQTYLRVSLEEAKRRKEEAEAEGTNPTKTERYLGYYAAVVSNEVPTIKNNEETFGYISSAAPDFRTGIRLEGKFYKVNNDPDLIKEVLYRKLSLIMMSAAMQGSNVLTLGAYGCGAFKNKPEIVASVINDLRMEERFHGLFTHIIMPIGEKDPNRPAFEKFLPGTAYHETVESTG